MTVEARRATLDDADELVRLRRVMFEGMAGGPVDRGWEPAAAADVRARLADGSLVAYVVDGPDGGLVASGVGIVIAHLPSPGNRTGRVGLIGSMATDEDHRRKGCGRAVFSGLMGWFQREGVVRVQLHATQDGEALYRSFGFTEGDYVELEWRPQSDGGSR